MALATSIASFSPMVVQGISGGISAGLNLNTLSLVSTVLFGKTFGFLPSFSESQENCRLIPDFTPPTFGEKPVPDCIINDYNEGNCYPNIKSSGNFFRLDAYRNTSEVGQGGTGFSDNLNLSSDNPVVGIQFDSEREGHSATTRFSISGSRGGALRGGPSFLLMIEISPDGIAEFQLTNREKSYGKDEPRVCNKQDISSLLKSSPFNQFFIDFSEENKVRIFFQDNGGKFFPLALLTHESIPINVDTKSAISVLHYNEDEIGDENESYPDRIREKVFKQEGKGVIVDRHRLNNLNLFTGPALNSKDFVYSDNVEL